MCNKVHLVEFSRHSILQQLGLQFQQSLTGVQSPNLGMWSRATIEDVGNGVVCHERMNGVRFGVFRPEPW